MHNVSFGVALCTCNGAEYIHEQLESIFNQTRLPQQLVIVDDASTDGTWEIISSIPSRSDMEIIARRNAMRIGVTKNFERAISLTSTELVALCDQDDVWMKDKLELLAEAFATSEEVLMVHSNAVLVDANLRDLKISLFEGLGLSEADKLAINAGQGLEVFLRRSAVTGATAAIRRRLFDVATPFPNTNFHDEWLSILASTLGRIVLLDRKTIQYRQHGKNVCGVKEINLATRIKHFYWSIRRADSRERIRLKSQYLDLLHERYLDTGKITRHTLDKINAAKEFTESRVKLPKSFPKRVYKVSKNVISGNYNRYCNDIFFDVARDIIRR